MYSKHSNILSFPISALSRPTAFTSVNSLQAKTLHLIFSETHREKRHVFFYVNSSLVSAYKGHCRINKIEPGPKCQKSKEQKDLLPTGKPWKRGSNVKKTTKKNTKYDFSVIIEHVFQSKSHIVSGESVYFWNFVLIAQLDSIQK